MSIHVYFFKKSKGFHLFDFGNFSLKKKENKINVKLCIMLSHALRDIILS